MAEELPVSLREYARQRAAAGLPGKTAPAVHKAIARGRLSRSVVRKPDGSFAGILPSIANQEWTNSTDPAQQRDEPAGGRPAKVQPDLYAEEGPRPGEVRNGPAQANGSPTFARARAVRETFAARLAELEYRERVGQLVDSAEVRLEAAKVGREVRQAILNRAGSLGPELAPILDPRELTARLVRELSAEFERLAGPEVQEP